MNSILEQFKIKVHSLTVNGQEVFVKALTVSELQGLWKDLEALPSDQQNYGLIISCLCDCNGNRLLSMSDLPEALNLCGSFVIKVASLAAKVNGLADDSTNEAKKNSEMTIPFDSLSDSQAVPVSER
jgi:hypothetical protein